MPELRSRSRIADIGSGAGFPGLPLAVALPAASVDLVEATARKCEVIDRLASAAGVGNAHSVAARAEELGHADYDVVTARAVAPLGVLAEYAAPLLGEEGVLVAWKGAPEAGEESVGLPRWPWSSIGLSRLRRFPAPAPAAWCVLRKAGPTPPGLSAPARDGAQAALADARAKRASLLKSRPAAERFRSAAGPGGAARSAANHSGFRPIAPVASPAWAPSTQSRTRRAGWARPPPP